MPTLSLDQFRARFPILGRRTYLNSCSQGALSIDVEQAMSRFMESWHERGSPWDTWIEEVERLRTAAAGLIGADPDEVAIVPSASMGISAIATALSFDGPRNRVVLGEFEFPTMAHAWLAQASRGAEVVWARAEGDTLPPAAYNHEIDERTLIVPATHVCFRNGYKLDVPALARLCHDRRHDDAGGPPYLFLDDYQHSGTGPLDVHALGLDMLVTGCLKYLLGPSGVAVLYVRRDLLNRLEPAVTGWFGRADPFAFAVDRLDWSPTARRFEAGTPPVPSVYGALAALTLLDAVGHPAVAGRITRLVERFHGWATSAGFDVATPDSPTRRGPLVVVRSHDAPALVERLGRRGIIASSRGNGLRVAFHGYSADEDLDAVTAALEAEAALLVRRAPSARR